MQYFLLPQGEIGIPCTICRFCSSVYVSEEEANELLQTHSAENNTVNTSPKSTSNTENKIVNSVQNNTQDYVTEKEATEYIMANLRVNEEQARKIVENIRRPNGTITKTVLNNLLDRVNKA